MRPPLLPAPLRAVGSEPRWADSRVLLSCRRRGALRRSSTARRAAPSPSPVLTLTFPPEQASRPAGRPEVRATRRRRPLCRRLLPPLLLPADPAHRSPPPAMSRRRRRGPVPAPGSCRPTSPDRLVVEEGGGPKRAAETLVRCRPALSTRTQELIRLCPPSAATRRRPLASLVVPSRAPLQSDYPQLFVKSSAIVGLPLAASRVSRRSSSAGPLAQLDKGRLPRLSGR